LGDAVARRKQATPPEPPVDDRQLARRARWIEVDLACRHADDREPIRAATLTRVRREAAKTDPVERLALMERAYIEVFGAESLEHCLQAHDSALERLPDWRPA
jgi:hypothetical protein